MKNNEFLDNNMMDDEQQTKVPSMNLPEHVKKKPISLPKIIVETRDPTKYTVCLLYTSRAHET